MPEHTMGKWSYPITIGPTVGDGVGHLFDLLLVAYYIFTCYPGNAAHGGNNLIGKFNAKRGVLNG